MPRVGTKPESTELGPKLSALVRELGIEADYVDGLGERQRAPREAVLAALAALGCPATNDADANELSRARERERARRGLSPVGVAWGGLLDCLLVRSEAPAPSGRFRIQVELEDGPLLVYGGAEWQTRPSDAEACVHSALRCRLRLPLGTHRLLLEWGSQRAETLIIAAPRRSPSGLRRTWGVFAPVYALRGPSQQGTGTLSELSALCELVAEADGDFVATLPMLAQFLDRPFDSSPFAPASRLFWNETLLDLAALPELMACADARRMLHSEEFRARAAELERTAHVQPRAQTALSHALLAPLARHFFAHGGAESGAFRTFIEQHPYAVEYARFRAVCDAHGAPDEWPDALKGRALSAADEAEGRYALHLYAQWQMDTQLARTAARARERCVLLQLDLPLGVHRASFDMWREPECFVPGLRVGAPRDALCPEGQDWGFAPAHPEGQRNQHYRYLRAYLHNQLRYAGILRIDHVMGLHRTFCVPPGMGARQGLYLRQPQEELHAIFALEATRSESVLVGEDLGTVPDTVREAMREHGMKQMYVVPFELERGEHPSRLRRVPEAAIASLNTHDLPTFAGLWQALDIDERLARGVLNPTEASHEREQRQHMLHSLLEALGLPRDATREAALRRAMTRLGQSEAEMVLIALEDLWGEHEPQNVPGTFAPERNFCRRLRYRLADIPQETEVRSLLKLLEEARMIDGPTPSTS